MLQRLDEVDLGINKPGTYVSFNWYVGYDMTDKTHVFRFMKGTDRKNFKLYCAEKTILYVEGPFKTRKAANEFLEGK